MPHGVMPAYVLGQPGLRCCIISKMGTNVSIDAN